MKRLLLAVLILGISVPALSEVHVTVTRDADKTTTVFSSSADTSLKPGWYAYVGTFESISQGSNVTVRFRQVKLKSPDDRSGISAKDILLSIVHIDKVIPQESKGSFEEWQR